MSDRDDAFFGKITPQRVAFAAGPGTVNAIDQAHRHLADATLGVVGLGAIGREVARRVAAFGMRVVAADPKPTDRSPEVAALWPVEELPRLLGQSDFMVIAASHTPQSEGMFRNTVSGDQFMAVRDGDASLLDRMMVLFGSGMAYGHNHGNVNLPIVLAGGKALGLKHGRQTGLVLETDKDMRYWRKGKPARGNLHGVTATVATAGGFAPPGVARL